MRLNLARKVADDELDKLDERIEDFKRRSKDARGVADSALDDIEVAARKLWEEIREGFAAMMADKGTPLPSPTLQ